MVNDLLLAAGAEKLPWPLVCLIGIAVVFVGLIIIIGLVELMHLFTKSSANKKEEAPAPVPQASAPIASAVIENRDEVVAAVCAAIAEENGTDISAIRVVSFKKI